jgi:hypothetical protein
MIKETSNVKLLSNISSLEKNKKFKSQDKLYTMDKNKNKNTAEKYKYNHQLSN